MKPTLPGARVRLCSFLLGAAVLAACSDSSDSGGNNPPEPPPPPEPELTYQADIVWTEYGIPHITAQDWGSLGYGYGYAYAQQNFCVAMKEFVRAAGESARYLGDEGNLNEDFVYKLFNSDERIERIFFDAASDKVLDLASGYAAGMNRYLRETGVDNLAEGEEGCRGAEWVREVSAADIGRLMHKAVLRGSSGPLADFATAVTPPEGVVLNLETPADSEQLIAALDRETVVAGLNFPTHETMGSNAYALGADAAQGSSGLLLGNPHFPWQGNLRWFMSHLTLGDEYNVMGATLAGLPVNTIGFNQNLAWTHTVSTGTRFTFYELELNPDNPLEYVYDGELREITAETVSAERVADDGSIETVDYTFYLSHFGPIVDLGTVSPLLGGWPNGVGTLLTYRDANLDNLRGMDQWIAMGSADDLGEFKEALRPLGIPWVNTIAADRYGDAFYGDISVVPHVSVNQYSDCIRGTLQTLLTDFGYVTMDGSDSACEWGSDEGTAEGIFGYDSLPKLETRNYGANANDSYWLANPDRLLTGFSPVIGREEVEQTLRTRQTFDQAERRLAGTDGLGEPGFNIDNLRTLLYQATNYTAQQVADDVVALCQGVEDWSAYGEGEGISLAEEACNVLAGWDKAHRLDSVGAHIFYEFWNAFNGTDNQWAVPFNPADPVNTPRQLNVADEAVANAVLQSLVEAVNRLADAGIPMDRPWGEVQYDEKNGERYGIHGGSGGFMFSAIYSPLVEGEGYTDIFTGNSYIQAVTWEESDCPDAYAILTYSQSTDPASQHYADSTALYSQSGWIDMPYCESDRDAQELRREHVEE
ncbi:penicillin acylase family protein [Parahaliea mediterranea]|uniref:penicillin acylase family protein n=1 Tax=Parahaliea mediterranea TaxID=651086 RepID=UPI000E2FA8EC|nr:penicillin acylase family protein [Parahaliea mediterranea]